MATDAPNQPRRSTRRTLVENLLSLAAFQAIAYLAPLLTLPYLARVLGAELLGVVAFAQALVTYVRAVVEYGFKLTATRDIAAARADPQAVRRIFCAVTLTRALLAAACLGVFALLLALVPMFRAEALLYLFAFVVVLGDLLIPVWFFQGMEDMKFITVLNVIARTLFTLAVFVFIREPGDYVWVPLLDSLGFVAAGLFSMAIVVRRFDMRWVPVGLAEVRAQLKTSFSVFVTDFVPNLYNNTTILLLGLFASKAQVGTFTAAARIVDVAISPAYVISRTYYPLLNRDFSHFRRFQAYVLGAGLGLSLALVGASDWLVDTFLTAEFERTKLLLKILGPSPLLIAAVVCYGTNYLLVQRRDQLYMRLTLAVSLLGFCAALVLVPWAAEAGASWSLVSSRTLLALVCLAAFLRLRGDPDGHRRAT